MLYLLVFLVLGKIISCKVQFVGGIEGMNTSDIMSADELELYLSILTGRAAWEGAA